MIILFILSIFINIVLLIILGMLTTELKDLKRQLAEYDESYIPKQFKI